MTDLYSGEPPYRISPVQGLRAKVGNAVDLRMTRGFFDDPGELARAADAAIVFVGNDPRCNRMVPFLGFSKTTPGVRIRPKAWRILIVAHSTSKRRN